MSLPEKTFCPDVLIVGGGLAGLMAALAVREKGKSAAIVSHGPVGRSGNSVVAGGVISAATGGPDNTVQAYRDDLLASGRGVADPVLASRLAEESGDMLLRLERLGVSFRRDKDGFARLHPPGHTVPRTVPTNWDGVAYSARGLTFVRPVAAKAAEAGVVFLEGFRVAELLKTGGRVTGVAAYDRKSGVSRVFSAGSVILACGGYGGLFRRHNNVSGIYGDGVGLALEAGCTVRDMEMVQFYPTMMFTPVKTPITGTLFRAGAVLRNSVGERFMSGYDPAGDVARRDAMARAIWLEVRAGRGKDGCAYVDCTAISEEALASQFARFGQLLAKHGLDLRKDWILGSPAVHYTLGGIRIDLDGRTDVPGLYAAGEVCGGVHGANRLAGAALMEAAVFGRAAGLAAATEALPCPPSSRKVVDNRPEARDTSDDAMRELRNLLWDHASLMRDAGGLAKALDGINRLREQWRDAASLPGKAFTRGLLVAEAVVRSAAVRVESRGAHYRSDYPATDPAWDTSVCCALRGGRLVVGPLPWAGYADEA